MTASNVVIPPTTPIVARRLQPVAILLAALIAVAALLPRLQALDQFLTTDEIFWAGRSGSFARGLRSGHLTDTFQTGHPGVTTMWVGALGMGLERASMLAGERREVSRRQVASNPDFLPGLTEARRFGAVLGASAIVLIALLALRLFGAGAALAGGLLLAMDPFLLAHSQLLHIDALLAGTMSISLLAWCVYDVSGGGRRYLVLSAAAAGLALLSKSPALFLVGFIPLASLASGALRRRRPNRAWLSGLLLWLLLAALTYFLAWPALWVMPVETLRGVLQFILSNAGSERATATVNPPFYLWTLLLRATPLTQIGLALLLVEGAVALRRGRPPALASAGTAQSRPLAAAILLVYALLFGLAMTLSAKSFDRYLLPAFPSLDLLAGLGLALSARRLAWIGGSGALLAGAFILPALFYPVATSLPYAIAWYNPLFGGGSMAARTIGVGWGEGLDQVARHLNRKPEAERLLVGLPGEIYTTVLNANFSGQVTSAESAATRLDYYVSYVRAHGPAEAAYRPDFHAWSPEHTVWLSDVAYAELYEANKGIPIDAVFGAQVRLDGFLVDEVETRPGRQLSVRLLWSGLAPGAAEHLVVVRLADSAGQEVLRVSTPLGDLSESRSRWRTVTLRLPPSLPDGRYLLWAGLETASGRSLPLLGPPSTLLPGAPERPDQAVLRWIRVDTRREEPSR